MSEFSLPDGVTKKIIDKGDGNYAASVTYKGTTTSLESWPTMSDANAAIEGWCRHLVDNDRLLDEVR